MKNEEVRMKNEEVRILEAASRHFYFIVIIS